MRTPIWLPCCSAESHVTVSMETDKDHLSDNLQQHFISRIKHLTPKFDPIQIYTCITENISLYVIVGFPVPMASNILWNLTDIYQDDLRKLYNKLGVSFYPFASEESKFHFSKFLKCLSDWYPVIHAMEPHSYVNIGSGKSFMLSGNKLCWPTLDAVTCHQTTMS